MSTIVILTTEGKAKKNFANVLHRKTGGAVKLVCLQKIKKKKFFQRIASFYKKVGFWRLPEELYHFFVLKFSRQKKEILSVMSLRSPISEPTEDYLAPTMEVDDINSEEIYDTLKNISPDLLIIWGGYIVKRHILGTARQCINMHFGVCPYYRGVNGVHHAILQDDLENMGITIHYVAPKVDAGEIISIVKVDHRQSPKNFFRELNDTATKEYVEIAKRLSNCEKVPSVTQDLAKGKNYLLKEWTYTKRDALARKLLKWREKSKLVKAHNHKDH